MRCLLLAVALLALLIGLQACGGGGSATTASSTGSAPPAAKAEKRAGAAKAFLEPTGDNSIPTFGREGSSAERKAAETALGAYLAARDEGAWAAACVELAASVRRQLQGLGGASTGCPASYRAMADGMSPSARANPLRGSLVSLRVKGGNGFALFYGPGRQKYVMPMAREDGGWKVTQTAPIAYPLGSEGGTP